MIIELLKTLQSTPIPVILIIAGLFFILLGFVDKLGGIIEVSPAQKRWTIPIGLLVLTMGLVINFTPSHSIITKPEMTKPEQSRIIGWIYIGKVKSGSKFLEDQRVTIDQVPSKNTLIIVTSQGATVRENADKTSTDKGFRGNNSNLKVEDVVHRKIDANYDSIWAKVSESSSN
jgi:hypothetical protein